MIKSNLRGTPTDHCPICSNQEEQVTTKILSRLVSKSFAKGASLISAHVPPQGIFLIAEGAIRVSRLQSDGRETILGLLRAGSVLGEDGIFRTEGTSESAVAQSEVRAYFLSKTDMLELLEEFPQLYPSILKMLTARVDKLQDILEDVQSVSARDKVLSFLKRLSAEQQSQLLHLPGKKHEVALLLGLRPETFSRTLAQIETEGLIKMSHKLIQLLKAI